MTRQLLILVAVSFALVPAMAHDQVYGVSLGGHLVPEALVNPGFFEAVNASCPFAKDIWSICECTLESDEASTAVKELMASHLQSFIDLDNLEQKIKETGINTVRYPISFTYFLESSEDAFKYLKYQSCGVIGDDLTASSFSDVLNLLNELDVDVILDLHQAVGCQNGFDNGGHYDVMDFYNQENVDETVQIWQNIVKYLDANNLKDLIWGFEVINEPNPTLQMQLNFLQNFTETVVNDVLVPWINDDQMIVLQIGPGDTLVGAYNNYTLNISDDRVLLDYHEYIVFGGLGLEVIPDLFGGVYGFASNSFDNTRFNYFVGEWSLATLDCAQYCDGDAGCFTPYYYENVYRLHDNFECNVIDQVADGEICGFQSCSVISTEEQDYPYCLLTSEYEDTYVSYMENMCSLFQEWTTGFAVQSNNIGYIFWTFITGDGETGQRRVQQWDFSWLVDNGVIGSLTDPQSCTSTTSKDKLKILEILEKH